ncbi:LysR family transcriptional regulator [Secundilactobacillus kimchicus]|uniref:LysR family transcriptional regulator n=1 Tax=Secundilactobacillus kimchicus TaxID=528209 RepID=UPI001C02D6B8|nr:LysR family transcriptional regulator [Secundilactobacillus kimchicus]MBT9672043.1 LysR family transcriptional regulator [Secundilactobacillus kimchicus]
MQTRDLDYFQSVATLKSFSQAAQAHHVSQPTITLAIKRLEAAFDTTLFIRDQQHHAIQLTDSGEHLLIHANRILAEMTEADREIRALLAPTISLGLPPIIGRYFFPQFVAQLNQAGILPKITTSTTGSGRLLQLLVTGAINIALIAHTPQADLSNQWNQVGHKQLLASYPFTIIDSKTHPFFPNKQVLTPSDLKQVPIINLSDDFIHASVLDYYLQSDSITANVIFTASEIDILKETVSQGLGVGLLTSLATNPNDNIVAHPITFSEPVAFNIYLVTRKGYVLNPAERQLADFFIN